MERGESLSIRSIVLDFRKVDFFDSMGVGLLVGTTKKLREVEGEVHVVVREGACLLVLRTTELSI